MADPNFKKISDMAALTTAAADDIIPIIDVSEASDANKNKKITTANLRKNITNAELAGGITAAKIAGISSDPNADRIVFWDDSATSLAYLAPSTGLQVTDTSITTKDSEIVHDNLSGFVANEHINHSDVTITAGAGLTGGGTIAANRTIALSHLGIQSLTDPGADRIAFWDDSAGAMKWLTAGSGLQISATTISAGISATDIADGAIDSNHIAAGAIDLAHMSANSIDSDQYVDGSIDTAHIGDNQVTAAKIANRTRTFFTDNIRLSSLANDATDATSTIVQVPIDYVSNMTVSAICSGGASGNVYVNFNWLAGSVGEANDTHGSGASYSTNAITSNLCSITRSVTDIVAGDILIITLIRYGANSADTLSGALSVYGFSFSYTADS